MSELMNKTSKLMLDSLKKENKKIQFQELLEKDKNWVC